MNTLSYRLWGPMALTLSLLLAGPASSAQASEYFGQRGQFFLGGSSSLNAMTWTHKKYRDPDVSRNDLTFGLAPELGVFVSRNVFIGADLSFSASAPGKDPGQLKDLGVELLGDEVTRNTLTLSAGPRVGFNLDFGRGVSLLPSLGVGYGLFRASGINNHGVHADLKVPFVFQIAHHGALLVGPTARYNTSGEHLNDPLPASFNVGLTGGLLIWI